MQLRRSGRDRAEELQNRAGIAPPPSPVSQSSRIRQQASASGAPRADTLPGVADHYPRRQDFEDNPHLELSTRPRSDVAMDPAARHDLQLEQHQHGREAQMASWRGGDEGNGHYAEELAWQATPAQRQNSAVSPKQDAQEEVQRQTGRRRVAFERDQRQETDDHASQQRAPNSPQSGFRAGVQQPDDTPRSKALPMEVRLPERGLYLSGCGTSLKRADSAHKAIV